MGAVSNQVHHTGASLRPLRRAGRAQERSAPGPPALAGLAGFPSAGPVSCDAATRGKPRQLILVGHGVPVCPRAEPIVRYVQPSLTVLLFRTALLFGAIRQVQVQPSARMDPMRPAILVIPTFGIYNEWTPWRGGKIQPANPNIPVSQMMGMAWITPASGRLG